MMRKRFYDDGTSKVLLKTFEMPDRQQSSECRLSAAGQPLREMSIHA